MFNFDINLLIDLIYKKQVYFKAIFENEESIDFNTIKQQTSSTAEFSNEFSNELEKGINELEKVIFSLEKIIYFLIYTGAMKTLHLFTKKPSFLIKKSIIRKGFMRALQFDETISSDSVKKLKKDFINNLKERLKKELEIDLDLDNLRTKI